MSRWVEWSIYGVIGFLVIMMLVSIVAESTAERFSLKKSDWQCTASHEQKQTTVAIIGGAIYPNTTTKIVCDRWERKP